MPHVTDEQARAAVEAYEQSGRNWAEAGRMLGLPRSTVQHHVKIASDRGLEGDTEVKERPFSIPALPSKDEPLEALLERRRATATRTIAAHEARELIPVKITMAGPIGLWLSGDPHLDNDGCDFIRLEDDLRTVANQPRILSANIGDVTDNWVGRLEKLYASSTTKAQDGWRLAEWMFSYPGINWLGLVGGNHDGWSGHRDPIKWIAKARIALYENDVLRLSLQHPNGEQTRIHARHDFKGNSIWNDMHGLKREVTTGWRDHLLVAGHRHLGEDGGLVNPDGFVTQLLRLSGYKRADTYAITGQFKAKPLHPSALVIINPDKPDTERGRVWVAPDVAEGVDYLKFLTRKA